jgi:glycosyltransferase involved in cell wall biosynthesis
MLRGGTALLHQIQLVRCLYGSGRPKVPRPLVSYRPMTGRPASAVDSAVDQSRVESQSRRTVRVLAVVGSLWLGGAEAHVARVAVGIRKFGVDMEVCALERAGPHLKDLEESGIVVHGTPYPTRTYRSLTMTLLRTANTIRQIVRAGRFDVVHTHLFWADVLGVAGARLAGCPRVIVSRVALHGWAHGPQARFHWLEQFSNLFAHELIANSDSVMASAERHERFLPTRSTVIREGVELGNYDTQARPGLTGPLRMVHMGALEPRKGQEYAIEAMSLLRDVGVQTTLTLIGSGSDEAMLRQKVADLSLAEAVTFAGPQPDPRSLLTGADLFVFPSRQEGFAIALLEAMASGLPVVATAVGGNREALVDGRGGRLVPPQDAPALASAIADLAARRQDLAQMGRFNRDRVEREFSLEATLHRLADWYLKGPIVPADQREAITG